MPVISEDYRELNRALHASRPDYGKGGHKWAKRAKALAKRHGTREILDYGAGKCTLAATLKRYAVRCYDPAVAGLDAPPPPTDVVVCSDVLEHIEPACLDAVLDDLRRVTRRVGLFVVATRPAIKTLPDGRNAHLIVEPYIWWLDRLAARFTIRAFENDGDECVVEVEPLAASPSR